MRPRHQQGQIQHKGNNWILKYYEDRIVEGKVKRVRAQEHLAPYAAYPYRDDTDRVRRELAPRIKTVLQAVNGATGNAGLDSTMPLADYVELRYFPRLNQRIQLSGALHIEPSTVEGYRDIFKNHVREKLICKTAVRDFDTRYGQGFLESLPQGLAHKTHLRIKAFISGVFTYALQSGVISGVNPMDNTKAGGRSKADESKVLSIRERKIRESNKHAYTLEEVAEMMDKLPEPARTVCAVAAFTGLSRSELPVLKWSDYDGKMLNVQRKKWEGHIGQTKTEAREAGVYVVPLLREILAKYKKEYPPNDEGWIFRGNKLGRPLDLDNLSRRDIPHFINGAWFGWHAFRRGLGTRLNEAGMDDKDIQSILRHGDISTTQAFYILPSAKNAEAGLRKLSAVLQRKYKIRA